MIKTAGLTHIHLVVGDLQCSLKFYRDVFGIAERFWDGPSMVFLNMPGSEDTVTLRQGEAGDGIGGGGVAHFGFRLLRKGDLEAGFKPWLNPAGRSSIRGSTSREYHLLT